MQPAFLRAASRASSSWGPAGARFAAGAARVPTQAYRPAAFAAFSRPAATRTPLAAQFASPVPGAAFSPHPFMGASATAVEGTPLSRGLSTSAGSTSAVTTDDDEEPGDGISAKKRKRRPPDPVDSGGSASAGNPDSAGDGSTRDTRALFLTTALAHVGQHGWTQSALEAAAAELELSPAAVGLAQRGPIDVLVHFLKESNREMKDAMCAMPLESMRIVDIVRTAVRFRLTKVQPHLGRWAEAMALGAQPQNAPEMLGILGDTVDDIWMLAGDTATDTDWYTKRALLSGVFVSTELFMLTDRSPNQEETWKFLDRRLEDVSWIASLPTRVVSTAASVGSVAYGALSTFWKQQQQQGHHHHSHPPAGRPHGE